VTINTGTSATIARPDTVAGQPERKPSRAYDLQTASGETNPVLKEALVELTLGQWTLRIWVFIVEVTYEFTLGLDVLQAYNASVNLGRHLLWLGQEEVTLWRLSAQPKLSWFSRVSDEANPAPCKKVVMARLKAPLGVTSVLNEHSQKSSRDEVFMASDRMKAGYGQLTNSAGFQEGNKAWLYHSTQKRGKLPQAADMLGKPVTYHHPDQ
jgi:hypothetical protein